MALMELFDPRERLENDGYKISNGSVKFSENYHRLREENSIRFMTFKSCSSHVAIFINNRRLMRQLLLCCC